MTASHWAELDPQRLVKTLQSTIFGPFVATVADDTMVREVAEQHVPLTTHTQQIPVHIRDLLEVSHAGPLCFPWLSQQQRYNDGPFGVCAIGWIPLARGVSVSAATSCEDVCRWVSTRMIPQTSDIF